jgi:UDP-N-acetylmuramyl pentapeptide phosphotransferase/UDP-N-acetylglucosamine-1-phosphate transferase
MELNYYYYFLGAAILLFVVQLIYFRIAIRYEIIDKPNERSSHINPVIRGGGILFVVSAVMWFVTSHFTWPWLILGVCIIAFVSFLDDIITLNSSTRSIVQLIAVALLFYQLWPIAWPLYLVVLALIICVGTLNAFNFMDGINGITGVYALVALGSFLHIQSRLVAFTDSSLIVLIAISVVVFLFFNFRKRAKCFAGDVGSVTIAFVLIFFLLQLIIATNNFLWPMLFLVYGTDSISTILVRLKRRENIFLPHRTHLFQYLSNELKLPHLLVSALYGFVQLGINLILIYTLSKNNYLIPIITGFLFIMIYWFVRVKVLNHIAKSS